MLVWVRVWVSMGGKSGLGATAAALASCGHVRRRECFPTVFSPAEAQTWVGGNSNRTGQPWVGGGAPRNILGGERSGGSPLFRQPNEAILRNSPTDGPCLRKIRALSHPSASHPQSPLGHPCCHPSVTPDSVHTQNHSAHHK